jgi:hypothetical protein
MITVEQLAALEHRLATAERELAVLKGETYGDLERRIAANTDKQMAAERAAQPRYEDHRRGNIEREMRPWLARERVLLAWQEENEGKLAEHLLTKPKHEGSAEWAIWNNTREALEDTRREILHGTWNGSCGYLLTMAKRDGQPSTPGLNHVRQTLAGFRQELEMVG